MKNLKVVTGILAIAFIALTVTSCKDNKKEHEHNDADQTEIKHSETAMVYACPMKCEGDKTYDKAGSCPTCGMDLKEVKKDSKMSNEMAMIYACPMKCEGDKTYDKAGSCPTCGMDLKEVKTDTEEDHSGHNH